MSLKTQAKVLRALQEQVVEPVGGTRERQGRRARDRRDQQGPAGGDPRRPVPRGPVLPPQRHPDLRAAAARARRRHRRCSPTISWRSSRASTAAGPSGSTPAPRRGLRSYRWPGNVRELRNVIERLMIMVPGDTIALARPGVPRRRRRSPAPSRPARRRCRCTRRASASSATTSCARWPRSTATSRAPPRRSASSAATCIAR